MDDSRQCPRCAKVFPVEEYYRGAGICRLCRNAQRQAQREARRLQEGRPVKRPGPVHPIAADGTKICTKCKTAKPASEFRTYMSNGRPRRESQCRGCLRGHKQRRERERRARNRADASPRQCQDCQLILPAPRFRKLKDKPERLKICLTCQKQRTDAAWTERIAEENRRADALYDFRFVRSVWSMGVAAAVEWIARGYRADEQEVWEWGLHLDETDWQPDQLAA